MKIICPHCNKEEMTVYEALDIENNVVRKKLQCYRLYYIWRWLEMIVDEYFVPIEFIDSYIGDIEYRVSTGRITPEDMKIVEKYKEYKQQHEFKRADLKKLMNILVGWNGDFLDEKRGVIIVVVAEIWRKLGYTEEQSEELEMLSTINNDDIKNIDSDTATKTLLKTMKKYRLDKDEVKRIIEKFNKIAN